MYAVTAEKHDCIRDRVFSTGMRNATAFFFSGASVDLLRMAGDFQVPTLSDAYYFQAV